MTSNQVPLLNTEHDRAKVPPCSGNDPRPSPGSLKALLLPHFLNKVPNKRTPGFPEGPRIEKIQSREAILKKSSFQYGMKFSIENEIFIPGPSLATEKQGLELKFSIENEIFKPRMKISSENENFVRGGMVFSCVRARMNFFDPRALWVVGARYDAELPPIISIVRHPRSSSH